MDRSSFLSQSRNRKSVILSPGDVVRAWGVGRVIASGSERFPAGSFVADLMGDMGIQTHSLLPAEGLVSVDPATASLSTYLGILGMPGLTAYAGMVDVGQPKPGEQVVVSGAAGSIGSIAGQIAKKLGCRVVGIAGGPEKRQFVEHVLGFDACIDHRQGDVADRLAELCPDGIDIYFDNVGGEILDACLLNMALRGRIVGCGFMSGYGGTPVPIRNYLHLLPRQVKWECISYYNLARDPQAYGAARGRLSAWHAEGAFAHPEILCSGIENFMPALRRVYEGGTIGKVLLVLDEG
jgi:NADPH-dependent curcumin reductase CurA